MKLTDRQKSALRRLWKRKDKKDSFTTDLAKQLEKKGLVEWTGYYYERHEWNRLIAKLRTVYLTKFGEKVCESIFNEVGD